MSELLPCPFCGSEAVCKYDSGNEVYNKSWQCKCSKCGVPTSKFFGSNSWAGNKKEDATAERLAIEAWNQRAPVAAPDEQGERQPEPHPPHRDCKCSGCVTWHSV